VYNNPGGKKKTRMKFLSMKTHYFFILGILLLVILFGGLSFPHQSATAQTESSPTPTPELINGEPALQSGETEGLILGAGIIMIIILGGVILQRTIINRENQHSPDSN